MKEMQSTNQVPEILREVDEFFMQTGPVQLTLQNIARRLSQEAIDYAAIRGMALVLHGFVRPTQDVDLLLTVQGLEDFNRTLVGHGYVPLFA